jgi:hypothetical protein
MADIYPFADKDGCMISGCVCPMRAWRLEIECREGNVIMWVCPCHFLEVHDCVASIEIFDKKTAEWRILNG